MSVSKLERLRELIRSYGSCLVAYSGGVDSVFLARVARDVLGERTLAVIADSPSLPRRELAEALDTARRFSIPVRVVQTAEFQNPDYVSNPVDRCYFCKHELFEELTPIARNEGFAVIAYGENASDVGDFRPGSRAAAEFQVRAPLKEAGLSKREIREFSAQLGLPTADKPQMACLSSRIPHGEPVSVAKLGMIEAAENVLRDLGFREVRVRHHEGSAKDEGRSAKEPGPAAGPQLLTSHFSLRPSSSLARIEVGADEMARLVEPGMRARVAAALREIGYTHVAVDLQGYRRGSLHEGLPGVVSGPSADVPNGADPAAG